MQPAMQHRRGRSMGSGAKERDEDLSLFHEMQKRDRDKRKVVQPHGGGVLDMPPAGRAIASYVYRIPASTPSKIKAGDDLLTSDLDKNDYDWLLTPPSTPLISSLDRDSPRAGSHLKMAPLVRSLTALKTSRLANATEPSSKIITGNVGARHSNSNPSFSASGNIPNRRTVAPTTSSKTASRPSTPTGRATIPSTASSRPPSLSRPPTPTRRPSTPSLHQSQAAGTTVRSSSVSKASSSTSRSSASSRGSSPTMRPRPWQPATMLGFSSEPPPNLRTTLPERSTSNTRGSAASTRPGIVNSTKTSQPETVDASNRSRRQSCSPLLARSRLTSNGLSGDRTNLGTDKQTNGIVGVSVPASMDSRMAEKVNRARSAALVQDDRSLSSSNAQVRQPMKCNTRDSSGFGRNLSKKSLDMALRHMDIRRSTPNGFRPLISNIPASALYSVRTGSSRLVASNSSAQSPIATSSNASSEHSMVMVAEPEGSEQGDEEVVSERGSKESPMSQPDSVFSLSKEVTLTAWAGSPDYRDDSVELMQLFRQGIERFSGSESPLVCQHGSAIDCGHCRAGTR
eukprot:c22176_g1_i2 orf=674-2380(-)